VAQKIVVAAAAVSSVLSSGTSAVIRAFSAVAQLMKRLMAGETGFYSWQQQGICSLVHLVQTALRST
jgi:hypothetical protein